MPSRTTSNPHTQGVNPFARALAEARGGSTTDSNMSGGSGGLNESSEMNEEDQRRAMAEQQRMQLEQQKRERLRQQLHREINPVEATDVFNARQAQVKKQIDELRHELKNLAMEIAALNDDIEIAIMGNVGAPGTDGSYYFTFFQKLKEFIILLRQKVQSARTWATAFQSKKKKKKNAPGMEIGGKTYEQTTTVFDRMHHERSTLYSGS